VGEGGRAAQLQACSTRHGWMGGEVGCVQALVAANTAAGVVWLERGMGEEGCVCVREERGLTTTVHTPLPLPAATPTPAVGHGTASQCCW